MTTKPPTELFDGPVCDRRYPVADYVQSFEFAQFLDLVVEPPPPEDNALMARSYQPPMNLVLVGDAATVEHAAARAAADGTSLATALGGVLLGQARVGERGLTLATAPVAAEAVEFTPADLRRGDAGLAAVVKRRTGLSLGPEALATLRAGGLTLTAAGEAGLRSLSLRPKPLTPRPRPPVDQKGGPELRMASSAMMASGASSDGPEIEASFAPERPGLQLAAVVPWVQRWKLLGYSRGKLVQSLTLAPQEETTIEVFTWDRQRRTLDQTSQTDVESSSESDFKRQDSLDTLNELLTGNELNREVGAQFAASYGTSERTYVKLDGQGKLSAKDSVNRTARQTGKRLSDMTAKASSRVKTQRSSKITEASEFGSETRVTRKIRNANMCRTLSFDYFELMVSYEVETEPDPEGVVLCMMVTNPFAQEGNPLEIPVFEDRHLRIYDSLLRPALLNAGLAAGFDGARLLSAREHAKAIACETYGCGKKAEAEGDDRSGELDTYKPPAYTTLPAWSTVVETGTALAAVAEALFNARAGGFFDGYTPDNRGGASAEGVAELKRFMFARLLYRLMAQLAGALDSLKGFTANPPTDPEALRDALRRVALNAPSGAGSGSAEALQPVLAAPPSSIEAIATEALAAYPEGRRGFLRGKADYWNAWSPNDGGLAPALDRFTGAWARFEQAFAASQTPPPGAQEKEEKAAATQDAQSNEDRLTYDFPTRDVAEATERVEALKTHLNLFKDYYRYVILRGLPPAEMLSRLATGLPPDRRNQLLQPRILAWRGDQVAVPVDPNADPLLAEVLDSVSEGLKDLPKVASFYASMPTPGLAMETRLGHCSGCEPYLEDSRAIELSQRKLSLAAGEIELERGKARLSASPPDLSPPNLGPQPALSVRLETPPKP